VSRGREILVGTVILLGLAVAGGGTLWLRGTNFGRPVTQVDVLLSDVGLLSEGNPVRFRGVTIGQVGSFAVEPDGEAVRVRLELDGDVALSDDAVVVIAASSLFGDWQAEIASRSAFPSFPFYEVTPADRRDGVRVLGGYALPDLTRLTAVAQEVAENLAGLTNRFDEAFNEETARNLARAIDNLEQLTTTLRGAVDAQAEDFTRIMDQIRVATEDIAGVLSSARSSFERFDSLLASSAIDSIVINTKDFTGNFRTASEDVSGAAVQLRSTMERADSALARLDRITRSLESGEGTLGRLLADTALAARAEGVLQQLDLLLADLRANPKKYVRLSIF